MNYLQAIVKGLDAATLKSFEVKINEAPMEICVPGTTGTSAPMQLGENGHAEFAISGDIQERIVQFHFQLTRASGPGQIANLRKMLEELLYTLKTKHLNRANLSVDEVDKVHVYLRTLFCILGQTRDIVAGKGERLLAYMQLEIWNRYFPALAKLALRYMTKKLPKQSHQYGCWKDPYGLYVYLQSLPSIGKEGALSHPLVVYGRSLYLEQMKLDEKALQKTKEAKQKEAAKQATEQAATETERPQTEDDAEDEASMEVVEEGEGTQKKQKKTMQMSLSLAAKWIPRETVDKAYFKALAMEYYPEYLASTEANPTAPAAMEQRKQAIRKCKTQYRKLLAECNRHLDTTQIKQCAKIWSEIDFDRVTSITIARQKSAFLNTVKATGEKRHAEDADREECAKRFKEHIEEAVQDKDGKPKKEVKGGRMDMITFVTQAIELGRSKQLSTHSIEKDLLNSQWRDNTRVHQQGQALANIIPLVDVSGSMEGDPMHVAIGLGIRISEHSLLPHRCLTFDTNPTWVDLSMHDNFVDKVNTLKAAPWGGSTNFQKAFELILDQLATQRVPPNAVQDLVLMILSDMQIDQGDPQHANESMYAMMARRFAEEGMRLFQQPYILPHIVFWNLRSTSGFPTLASQQRTSMMSGFSPALLNIFCAEGMTALAECTPWQVLVKSLQHDRYAALTQAVEKTLFPTNTTAPTSSTEEKVAIEDVCVEVGGKDGKVVAEKEEVKVDEEEEVGLPDWKSLDFQPPSGALWQKHVRPEVKRMQADRQLAQLRRGRGKRGIAAGRGNGGGRGGQKRFRR